MLGYVHPVGGLELLPEHDAVAVGSDDGELAHPPRQVAQRVPEFDPLRDELRVQRTRVVDVQVGEPRVVLRLRDR